MPRPGTLPTFPGATPGDDQLDASNSPNAVQINGKGGSDKIWGSAFADAINGGAGDDHIYAAPNDTLVDGGSGNDTADFSLYQADSSGWGVNARLFGGGLGLWPNEDGSMVPITGTIKNVENIIGSNFADALVGNNYVNVLDGRAGTDWVVARGAGDILSGGADGDRFALDDAAGRTSILDFNYDDGDRIHFDRPTNISWSFDPAFDHDGVNQSAWIGSYVDWQGNSEEVVLLNVGVTPQADWTTTIGF